MRRANLHNVRDAIRALNGAYGPEPRARFGHSG